MGEYVADVAQVSVLWPIFYSGRLGPGGLARPALWFSEDHLRRQGDGAFKRHRFYPPLGHRLSFEQPLRATRLCIFPRQLGRGLNNLLNRYARSSLHDKFPSNSPHPHTFLFGSPRKRQWSHVGDDSCLLRPLRPRFSPLFFRPGQGNSSSTSSQAQEPGVERFPPHRPLGRLGHGGLFIRPSPSRRRRLLP